MGTFEEEAKLVQELIRNCDHCFLLFMRNPVLPSEEVRKEMYGHHAHPDGAHEIASGTTPFLSQRDSR